MLRKDWFVQKDCPIYQNPDHFCFNTDSVLLAQFVDVRKDDRVLEIGCNNGALLVWMSRFCPARLDGVEILEEPARLARYNKEQFIHSPGEIFCQDVKDLSPCENGYTLIVSNPPYFPIEKSWKECDGSKALSLRQLGRVELNLDLETLVAQAARLLQDGGRLALVHRPERLQDLCVLLHKYGFSLSRLQFAADARDGQVKTMLAQAVYHRDCQLQVLPQQSIGQPAQKKQDGDASLRERKEPQA